MSDATTPRLGLEQIQPGQAQKELSHNEALALLDLLVQPVVEAIGTNDPPTTPIAGQAWIVGTAPSGDWADHAGALAGWTDGGWRFVVPFEGLCAWSAENHGIARFSGIAWEIGVVRGERLEIDDEQVVGARQAAIADPDGGTVVDTEGRSAIGAILAMLRTHGLIES
jgi:hypothetical protein